MDYGLWNFIGNFMFGLFKGSVFSAWDFCPPIFCCFLAVVLFCSFLSGCMGMSCRCAAAYVDTMCVPCGGLYSKINLLCTQIYSLSSGNHESPLRPPCCICGRKPVTAAGLQGKKRASGMCEMLVLVPNFREKKNRKRSFHVLPVYNTLHA